MKLDPNAPAYPTISAGVHLPHHGMTIRATMAKDILAGYSAAFGAPEWCRSVKEIAEAHGQTPFGLLAEMSVTAADALIAELNRTQP